jgi:hypothetical protein
MLSTSIIASVALLGALTSAIEPRQAPHPQARQVFMAFITFEGATPDANFTMSVPTDDQPFVISKSLLLS